MNQQPFRTRLAHPTPELPVEDVERAQQHYRDALGFEIGCRLPLGERMLTGILIIATAGLCALLASRFMWWATKRSAIWAMCAGGLLLIAVFVGAIIIAWLYTRAAFGP